MPEIQLDGSAITVEMTANSSISDEEVVGAVGADSVAPISDTDAQSVIGVADGNANAGEAVEVVILGKKQVTADGPVSVGQPVTAATTAGRCVSEASIPASHTHTMPNHDHNVVDHSHTMPTHGHTALESGGSDTTPGAHQAMTDGAGAGTTIQVGVDASGQAADTVPTSSDDPGDTNDGGPGSTDTADPGDTNSADAGPEHGRTFGKAISPAAAAGDTITVLVSMTA